MHATLTNAGDCHMTRRKDGSPLIFLAVFMALCFWQVCVMLQKSRLRREYLMWKHLSLLQKIISFEEVTGV